MTRKFALPKLRIARMRPAVRVSDCSRLELLAGLRRRAPSTSSSTVCVRSNACGYGIDAEALTSSSKFAAPLAQLIGLAIVCSSVISVGSLLRTSPELALFALEVLRTASRSR